MIMMMMIYHCHVQGVLYTQQQVIHSHGRRAAHAWHAIALVMCVSSFVVSWLMPAAADAAYAADAAEAADAADVVLCQLSAVTVVVCFECQWFCGE